ncbi:divergent polysaccharide deacetylase family protein [Thalassospira xiamenensis]|uniref:divergent polysaccharide deacetylase family protein n=1 Tax=Thalassospira xiamenensis TaxID=220697 RepID=UPI003AA80C42
MARRAQPAKKKKAAPRKRGRGKAAPKKKSGGIGRLMLGGAIVAGTISAFIAAGSMLELDRASRDLGERVTKAEPEYTPEPAPVPESRNYDFSESNGNRDRTGYMVGERTPGENPAPVTEPEKTPVTKSPDPALSPDTGGISGGAHSDGPPPWQKFAALAPDAGKKPVIAIVIDDAGLDQPRTARTTELPGPITISYLPYARDLQPQVNAARKAGHEVMLHMPMEPSSKSVDPGPHALFADFDRQKILSEMNWMLDRFDGYVGVNNHMGSKFTADPERMQIVMEVMKSRGLLFLDSRTSAKSVGYSTANQFGVPAITRDVFIDDADDATKIAEMLERTERVAAKQGYAIAIGHPRDLTISALQKWIPDVLAKGFVLVPVTDVLHRSMQSVTG